MVEYTTNLNLKKHAYDEFADVADINANMELIDKAFENIGADEELEQRVVKLEIGKADKNHASTTTDYGAATTTKYGHTKLYSGTDSDSESLAATPKAVKTAVAEAKYITDPDNTKFRWGIDSTGIYLEEV